MGGGGGDATLHKSGSGDSRGMGFRDGAHTVRLAQQVLSQALISAARWLMLVVGMMKKQPGD